MAPTAVLIMLLTYTGYYFHFQQDVIFLTPNAPLLTARRPILSIVDCSSKLPGGDTRNNNTTATTVCSIPRKHTRFKPPFSASSRTMQSSDSTTINKDPLRYEKHASGALSVSTAASTLSTAPFSMSSVSSTSLLTSSTNPTDDETLLLTMQGEPLILPSHKHLAPGQRQLRTGGFAPTKTQLDAERRAINTARTKAKEDEKISAARRKSQLKADREERRMNLAEDRARKATARAEAARKDLEAEVRKQEAAASNIPGAASAAHAHKKIKGTSGPQLAGLVGTGQYQSPQRKSTGKGKRISVRSPKNFSSDVLSVTSGSDSDSDSSSSGVLTIGDDTSDSDKSAASARLHRVHASERGLPSEQRGGRKYGTPLRRSRGKAVDRQSKSATTDHSPSSSEPSDDEGSFDSEGGDTAGREVDKTDRITPMHGIPGSLSDGKTTGKAPASPPKVQRGLSTTSLQRMPTLDEQDTIENSMLDGVWPGGQDIQLVQRFVKMHFADDWTTYLYFAQWAGLRRSGNPAATVRLGDWLSVDEEEGGGRRRMQQDRYQIGQLGGVVDNSNLGSIAGESSPRSLTPAGDTSKAPKSTPRYGDIRTMFLPTARIVTQAEQEREATVDRIIAEQEEADLVASARSKARREDFEARARLKVNGPQGQVESGRTDVEMKDAGHTPFPQPRRGSTLRKSTKLSNQERKAKETERIAESARTLAASLRDSSPLIATAADPPPNRGKEDPIEALPISTPLRATVLFQTNPITTDIRTIRRDSVHFSAGLKSPPEQMGTPQTQHNPRQGNTVPPMAEAVRPMTTGATSSALRPSNYPTTQHNHVPVNDVDNTAEPTMFSVAHKVKPGCTGETWFLQVGIDFAPEYDAKTTMLMGLQAMMSIMLEAIEGFALHPVDKASHLPILTSIEPKEGFPLTAVLAFQYFYMRNKRDQRKPDTTAPVISTPSPHRFNDEEEYKAPKQMWGVIRVSGNGNIKESCEALAWDIGGSGLQVRWKEYQSAESSAQVILLNVPPILERGGVEEEITWHLQQIEKSLLKEGKLPQEFVGVPLPRINVSWRQSKQGKGRTKEERLLSLNLLGSVYQQNGCPVCTVEVEEGSWTRLGPLWEIFHSGLSRRALGRKCLMVVMYNGKETGGDRITMQRLRRVNVMYQDSISHMIIPYVAVVHKRVEVQMADSSRAPIKFTDLSREFMLLTSTNENGELIPMFDVIMPLTAGIHCGSAVVTFRHDNREAAILIRKIRQSVASWWYGYWTHVSRYKEGMIKKLMESFDTDAAKLAGYSTFNVENYTVNVEVPDVDGRLDDLERELGLDSWEADTEEIDGIKMTFTGHKQAVSKTLRDRPDDIFDCDRSGASRRTDFSQSTGNSTNNSDASVRQHKRRAKALKAIELVDKNYALEAKVLEAESQIAESQAQVALVLAELERYKQLTFAPSSSTSRTDEPMQMHSDDDQSYHSSDESRSDESSVSLEREEYRSSNGSASDNEARRSDESAEEECSAEEDDQSSPGGNDGDTDMEYNGPELIRGGSDTHSFIWHHPQARENNEWDVAVLDDETLDKFITKYFGHCYESYFLYTRWLQMERAAYPTALCSVKEWREQNSGAAGDGPEQFEVRSDTVSHHESSQDSISVSNSTEFRQGFLGLVRSLSDDTLSAKYTVTQSLSLDHSFPRSISAQFPHGISPFSKTLHPISPPSPLTQEPSPRKSDGRLQSGRGAVP